ncbi:MAG: peptidylprolyl isomerase [Bacteroidota bacterium]
MINRLILWMICLCLGSFSASAQNDPVLFTVENTPVNLSEFKYIYSKTNGEKADFSEKSLREYLDLYVKFKLKVQRARDMKLDTIKSLQNELEGYRKQLANSYLVDKEVTERLVKEAYERSKTDVDISHIMIRLGDAPSPADTLQAYKRAMSVRKMISQGQSFEDNASRLSDDKATKTRKGRIGYVTALLPNGFYAFESAAYNLKKGEVSNPVRTSIGYHLIKRNGSRPARGEMEAAHIFVRIDNKKGVTDAIAKARIDSLYQALQAGADFAALAKKHSNDKKTANKGGNIGFFGINRYELSFENAAFGLAGDGDYSKPVKTQAGWHIIKRISKKGVENYDIAKRRLQTRIQNDNRYALAKEAMVNRIKEENGFQENTEMLDKYIAELDEEFLTYKWKPINDEAKKSKEVFTIGGKEKRTLGEFESYVQRASRQRLRAGKNAVPAAVARKIYQGFVEESAIRFEESQLEAKYPEFKALMREYREGILLFEATKNLVWDKASQDTTGLAQYHNANKDKYMWGERARLSMYTINAEAGEKVASKARKCARKKGPDAVMKDLGKNKQFVAVQEKTVEEGKEPALESIDWKKNTMTELARNPNNNSFRFVKIEEILPATPKSLGEARGYIIADYQDFLEKQWVESLQKDYKVSIDEKVFKSMVK